MALQYAIAGVARCANTRSDYYRPIGQVSVGGTLRSALVDKTTCRIVQSNDGQANTATFECFDFTPVHGQEVIISIGTTANRLFAGHILSVTASAPHLNQRVRYRVTCLDYSWLLDTRRITGRRYVNTSATAIITDLMLLAPSGFSTSNVQTSMPPVDFTANHAETLLQAVRRLMKMVGGYVYVDYTKGLHAYITPETDANPLTVNGTDFPIWDLTYEQDLSQVRTRVYVMGATTQTSSYVSTSATVIPVNETSIFSASSGGQALAYGNQLSYGTTSPTAGAGVLMSLTGLSYAIPQGDSVRVLATRVNSNAASSMAAIIGSGDGLIDHVIDDSRLSDPGARDRGDAELDFFAAPEAALRFTTRAKFMRAGKTFTASLSAPAAISGTFLVQHVTIRDLDVGGSGNAFPIRDVQTGTSPRDVYELLAVANQAGGE